MFHIKVWKVNSLNFRQAITTNLKYIMTTSFQVLTYLSFRAIYFISADEIALLNNLIVDHSNPWLAIPIQDLYHLQAFAKISLWGMLLE